MAVLVARYEAGLTIREIAAQGGLPKTTVQTSLARGGVDEARGSPSYPAGRLGEPESAWRARLTRETRSTRDEPFLLGPGDAVPVAEVLLHALRCRGFRDRKPRTSAGCRNRQKVIKTAAQFAVAIRIGLLAI
jgi:hypothetical protein